MGTSIKRLCVEGWRFLHHSYALVNQWQLLALLKRPDVALSTHDVPLYNPYWRRQQGLFSEDEEGALAAIPDCDAQYQPDAIFKISFPLDLSLHPGTRKAVFGTAELQTVPESSFARPIDLKGLRESDSFLVITPSQWSRQGFLRLGLRPEQVRVVPHGVQTDIFRPGTRPPAKEKSGFVFAHASAMTNNKGTEILLRAFAAVASKHPDVRLLLKGTDGLYSSKERLAKALGELPAQAQHLITDRMTYTGEPFSVRQMADFYRSAGAYVSPYRAEGFNLPVLESAASGTPVICTKGGPTDEFMRDDFTLFIDSLLTPIPNSRSGSWFNPSLDHLIELMFRVMDDAVWRKTAALAGPSHAANFNWSVVVDKLLSAIFAASR
jgi:glycosyltransferase involved in cell wall biosynthesis